MPDNQEKYNKILSYFDLSLDTLDWEELNREAEIFFQLKNKVIDTMKCSANFSIRQPIKNGRILYNFVLLYKNKNINSIQDFKSIKLMARLDTKRYYLGRKGMASYELEWNENFITCENIIKEVK
ncbi:hypothetical protein [Helicobacter saguini]|uniref:hypothetical protein n=1 Tax=Helicobacter saguini TaxID=1548018 RepID=UPI00301BAEC8